MQIKIRVIQWGVGNIGRNNMRMISQKQSVEVVGAIVKKLEADFGKALRGFKEKPGFIFSDKADEVLKMEADVVLINTPPSHDENMDQISRALRSKKNVITTVDFQYPWETYPELAHQIDRLAKENGVSFLGTGFYPGWFMTFPGPMTGGLARIDRITVQLVDDLTEWDTITMVRDKYRLGIPPDEFNKPEIRPNWIFPQVGQLAYFLAAQMGWKLDSLRQPCETFVAKERLRAACMEIEPGTVCGYRFTSEGVIDNEVRISVIYSCLICPEKVKEGGQPGVSLWIDGRPSVGWELKIDNLGHWISLITAAHGVNAIPLVVAARPGLLSLKDLPPVTAIK